MEGKENKEFLNVKNLVVEYTSEGEIVQAVNNVSFQLGKGRTLGLVGETGAGKTTIAKTLLRILPEYSAHVKGGDVWMDGQNLLDLPEEEMMKIRGRKISMIFQDPMTALNPIMEVGEQIAEVILVHNDISRAEANKRAVQMLEMVGIPGERFHEFAHQFSGGMKQRVVIAMALACQPDLLIADEPTTALDVTIQAQVLEMINDLKKQYNTAMIMITHDLGIIAQVCDDVAVIYAGEIVEYGALRQIFKNPCHPYTVGLFNAIPKLDSDVNRLTPIPGFVADPTHLPAGCHFGPRCEKCTEKCSAEGQVPFLEVEPGHFCRCFQYTTK
ncbi:MAG: ABC transporter ATP-binding protein [Lachnospiraceae bacterium]|nr:ABC transporter ATP-binding protein [Lachnospiraceae bacterium]